MEQNKNRESQTIQGTRYTIQHVHQNSFVPLLYTAIPIYKIIVYENLCKVFFVLKKPSSFSPKMI